jgi:hypothetical protein
VNKIYIYITAIRHSNDVEVIDVISTVMRPYIISITLFPTHNDCGN